MAHTRFQLIFFILFTLIVFGLNVAVFFPYISVLFLALVFAIIFDPLFIYFQKACRGRDTVAAFLTTLIVLLLIVGPISFFGTLLFQEASDLYISIIQAENGGVSSALSSLNTFLSRAFPGIDSASFQVDIASYAESALSWLVAHLSVFFSGVLKIVFGLLLLLLALFYFFRDGKKFMASLVELSPLNDSYDRKIIDRMVVAVNSVVRGHIIIGIVQGTLAGIGFAIFGVPSPVLWGTVAAIASLIPTIGTSIVLIPGILFLFFTGNSGGAIGLLIWGGVAVGLIDNFLGPQLIKRGVKIHPLLILLSALGGVAFFGPIGFLAGPVLLSLLFALLDIYPGIVKTAE
jgi:predicted PurR-regulated permease PerM